MLKKFATLFIAPKNKSNINAEKASRSSLAPNFSKQDKPTEQEKFNNLVNAGTKDLLKVKTVFPLDFFPDELIIDPLKINYIKHTFFFEEQVKSILIESVGHVFVSSGPLFSTLTIVDTIFAANTIIVKPLLKKDALKVQNLLQGMVVSRKQNLDPTKVINKKTLPVIEQLGKSTD